ncbi:unnamed protein product [Acanthoscelides obtectus]|nr:unnamed protein product [Acanthoscelides obtectus]CAK1655174.1 Chitotriosidase-1 [Acanthoscelides obtectus]
MDPYLDFDLGNIKRFNAMKEVNPSLKTLVAIGGWNEGSQKYSAVAASPSLRNTFVQSALKFVLDQGFDGFDLDWEYPARRGGSPTDKVNYVTLIKELKSAFEEHGLLLSAAVSATGETIDTSYNVTALSQYLDMINVMSYDLHGSWDKVTGHNAPLYPSNLDNTADSKELNLVSCAEAWLSRGASRSKLNLGLAFYGRSFTLSDAQNNGLGAPISAPGLPGRYSGESGMLTYYEIVEHLTTNEWTYRWDSEQEVPHIYKSNQWIGFDDANSIAKKVKYAKDEQLGGVMVWSVESDDFSGLSGIKYPLLRAAYQMADDGFNPTIPPTTSTMSSPATPTDSPYTSSEPTENSPTSITHASPTTSPELCSRSGFIRDPDDCRVFYYCPADGAPLGAYKFICQDGTLFDTTIESCNWAYLVKDCGEA